MKRNGVMCQTATGMHQISRPIILDRALMSVQTRQITRDVVSCVRSGLGPRPDTLISTGGAKGYIIFLFQGTDPNTH